MSPLKDKDWRCRASLKSNSTLAAATAALSSFEQTSLDLSREKRSTIIETSRAHARVQIAAEYLTQPFKDFKDEIMTE
jgi:hypothetical protein